MSFWDRLKWIWGIAALVIMGTGIFPNAVLGSEAQARIDWQYRDGVSGAHPGQVQVLPNNNILFVLNGYQEGKVLEINRDGKVEWRLEGINANSAVRLNNGNTLISETATPGKPGYQRVVEVNPEGKQVWEYRIPAAAQGIRHSEETGDGKILITTRNKVLLVNRAGQIELELNADKLGSSNQVTKLPTYGSINGDTAKVTNLVSATELPTGNILIVDQGVRTGGRVLEVSRSGQLVQEWKDLSRPKAAMRQEGGRTAILDTGAYALLIYDKSGRVEDVISYRQVITELPVLNQWGVTITTDNHFVMGLSYTNGQSLLVEINDKVPKLIVDGKEFTGTAPFMAEGRMFGPMRELFNSFGINLHWDNGSNEMVAVYENTTVKFKNGSSIAEVNGRQVDIGAEPRMVGNLTYVPLRIFNQCFGFKLEWDGKTRTTIIERP
ncbi:hypothetical protein GGQ84_000681 [Desulfitispora alkaliphila]|uniref:copper amine oxidase N-terminal domain-containing protein n=1 Tax=Desulfitispora alkaliphila TaxID=622674 RepID=UPI003D2304FC